MLNSLKCLNANSINLMQRNRVLKPLIKAELIKDVLNKIDIEEDLKEKVIKDFRIKSQIDTQEKLDKWLSANNYDIEDFIYIALSEIKIRKYCDLNFSNQLEPRFLQRKSDLDIIIYSLLRLNDPYTAREYYLRIAEKEEDFGDLSSLYSLGIERKTRGIVGPIPIGSSHPMLSELLTKSEPGVVQPPIEIEGQYLIIRVESYEPAKLDDFMRMKMGEELFNSMLEEEADKIIKILINDNVDTQKVLLHG